MNPQKETSTAYWREELQRKLKWLLIFRLCVVVVLFGAVFLFLSHIPVLFRLLTIYGVVTLGYLAALYFWRAVRKELSFRFLFGVQIFMELAVEAAIVHYSGGEGSLFSFLFALTILSSAFVYRLLGTVLTATAAAATFTAIAYLEFNKILEPAKTAMAKLVYSSPEAAFAVGYIQICLLYIIAFVSGYLSQKLRAHLEELEETKRELERIRWSTDQILQHMWSGLITVDEEGFIVYFNQAASRILQLPAEDVVGRRFTEALPERVAQLRRSIQEASTKKAAQRTEIEIENRYGQKLPLALVVGALRVNDQPQGVIALFEDITEEKKKERLLQQMEKLAAIGELSARLAHELRNPLAAIRGGVEMLRSKSNKGSFDQRIAELVIRESDRLTQILEEFLTFARLKELPPEQFRTEVVDLSEVVDQVIEATAALAKNKNVRLENKLPPRTLVHGRKDKLTQVFANLLANALEAIENKGEIVVAKKGTIKSPLGQEELLGISVCDNGKGIPPEDIPKIFEPFFTTKPKGVGLGLSIVQGIVNQHGGYIEVKSRLGEGTEFIIYLPKAKPAQTPQGRQTA